MGNSRRTGAAGGEHEGSAEHWDIHGIRPLICDGNEGGIKTACQMTASFVGDTL